MRLCEREAAALAACVAALALFGTGARGQAVSGVDALRVASGISQPLFVTAPPGDYNRLFIVCRTGEILILNLMTGTINATPFINVASRISTAGERGLLGMAFDPNYPSNGKFYLNFVAAGGAFGGGKTHISQFTVSADANIANLATEKILLTFDQVTGDHNGGWIGFSNRPGDANNLYISTGDGGCCNDQGNAHIEPGGNAQNLTTLLGKMLRIHVDSASGTYSIPADNPFFGSATMRQEIWGLGLRNPFRASFDRLTSTLFIGDVGQGSREEISVQLATNPGGGENYGWRLREGTMATPSGNPAVGGSPPPGNVNPVFDYSRSTGTAVIGGYVYRGRQIPILRGRYVFADFGAAKIFTLAFNGTTASNFQDITGLLFPTFVGNLNLNKPSSFGEDANGELYITDIGAGSVFKIVPMTSNVEINSVARSNGHFVFSGFGVPFKTHTVQAASVLPNSTPPFATIGTATAAGNGSFEFDDTSNLPARFYRVTYP